MLLAPSVARQAIAALAPHVKPRRVDKMRDILTQRRVDVELVLENLVDDSNAVWHRRPPALAPRLSHLHVCVYACVYAGGVPADGGRDGNSGVCPFRSPCGGARSPCPPPPPSPPRPYM